jgi:hypothetical protein
MAAIRSGCRAHSDVIIRHFALKRGEIAAQGERWVASASLNPSWLQHASSTHVQPSEAATRAAVEEAGALLQV